MGYCRYCGHRAGWFHSSHRQCAATYRQGLAQLVDLVVTASGRPDFTQRRMLRILDRLAQQCYVPAEYLPAVLAAGWHLSDLNRMVDDVLTRLETARLREFRDGHHPASETPGDRWRVARAARASGRQGWSGCSTFCNAPAFSTREGRELLLQAWETAVARQLDDGELDHNGMLRQLVQGAAIAESAAGLVTQRMNFPQGAPAAALLRRSEQLVWLFDDVECCLGQLPPEPATTITGVAAPVVRGSPGARPGLGIRGTGSIGGGQPTPAFPWTGPQYPVGPRLGGALGAVPRRHRRRAALYSLRNNSKRSTLCLTTVVLLGWVVVAIKDDAVVSFGLHRLTLTPLPGTLLPRDHALSQPHPESPYPVG